MNHKAVLRLTLAPDASAGVNKLGIHSRARKRKLSKKLDEIESYHRYPNLLNRDFVASAPNQKWITDVTYILTRQGWAYLSTIKDLFDGFIVASVFARNNAIELVTKTVHQAKKKKRSLMD